jgi:hypothetical protein
MSTYLELKTEIETEIEDTDLSDEISLAIHNAILFYEAEHHYLAEAIATAMTESSVERYAMPDDFVELDAMNITVQGHKYPLTVRTPEYLDAHYDSLSTYTGPPEDCSVYAQELRLQPTPDQTYTLEMAYRYAVAPPLSDSASNVWTNSLKILVKSRAKYDLYMNTMHDAEMAGAQKQAEQEAFAMAERRRHRAKSSGKITPRY